MHAIGRTLHVSGVDLIDGTPVLDIKPYIPQYDQPVMPTMVGGSTFASSSNDDVKEGAPPECDVTSLQFSSDLDELNSDSNLMTYESMGKGKHAVVYDVRRECSYNRPETSTSENGAFVADWLQKPPVSQLKVVFTERCEQQIYSLYDSMSVNSIKPTFLKSIAELKESVENVLRNDPRSTYRRTKTSDRLYYFIVDKFHVTSWFDDEQEAVEVLKIRLQE